jgi:hypothetical protein
MVAALLCIAGLLGPPKLPPMPGQGGPAQPEPSAPTAKPGAAKPTKPATAKPTTAKPATPTKLPTSPAPADPPASAPEPAATPEDPFQLPDAKAEPPQPEPTATPKDADARSRGKAPPRPAVNAGEIPGEGDRVQVKLPPPARPPFTGIGLFAGAGVAFGVAIAEQVVGQVLVQRQCIDPIVEQSEMEDPIDEEAEQIGNAIIKCGPGALPAIALRVHSDLALIAAIGMAAGGAALRAQRNSYDHVFSSKKRKDIGKLRWAGVGLVIGGVVTYLVTGPTSWAVMSKCSTGDCVARMRIMGWVTRDVSTVMIAGGAGMLAYAESYRINHEKFTREKALSFAPSFGRGFAGFSMSGRF